MDGPPYYIENAEQIAGMFKALAHPIRLTLFAILAQGPRNVNDLVNRIGLPQGSVSHHLKILQGCGLLKSERRRTFVQYALMTPSLTELVSYFDRCSSHFGAIAQDDKL